MMKLALYLFLIILAIIFSLWTLYRVISLKKGTQQAKKVTFSILSLFISFTLCLIVAEVACRIVFKDVTTTANNTSYFSERWRAQSKILPNSLGYREKEFDQNNQSDNYRIAVIGDSFTYGQGILISQRFSNLVEAKLNKESSEFEVLNFGIPGAETVDHITILNQHVIPSNPDFILLQWFVNDVEGGNKTNRPSYKRLIPSWTITIALNEHSALYFLVNSLWVNLQSSLGWVDNYEKHLINSFSNPDSEASEQAHEAMQQFIEICKNNSIPVGIVLFPMLSESLNHDYSLGFLSERVMNQCKKMKINCLDLRTSYTGIEPISRLWVNRFDQHPGAFANEIAAEKIIGSYAETWQQSKKAYK